MTTNLEIYKCDICGNIVEMVHSGAGQLVCCGQPMTKQAENTTDAAREKHVPVAEKTPEGVKVKVGSTAHPMEEKHYIEWIEVIAADGTCRHFLRPGQAPEALFSGKEGAGYRAYCNLHGLWKG